MSNELRTCAICDGPFTESNEAVECYGCQSIVHDDCARTVQVEPDSWESPAVYEWCCDDCYADDEASAEFAAERAAENRADQRAADRAHMDDMRY
jgi:hypothetical protein